MDLPFRSRVLTLIALGAVASAVAAQDPLVLPDGAELLDRVEKKAFAGRRIDRIDTLHFAGTCEFVLSVGPKAGEPSGGTFEEFHDGAKYYHVTDLEQFGRFEEGSDGKVVWEIDPAVGAVLKKGADRALTLRINALTRGEPWRTWYDAAECTGVEELGGEPHFVLAMTPKEGGKETWYVRKADEQLVGMDLRMNVGGDRQTIRVRCGDFAKVDGVEYPRSVTVSFGVVEMTLKHDTIEHNVEIPASRFALPRAVAEAARVEEETDKKVDEDDSGIEVVRFGERRVATVRTKVKTKDIGSTLAVVIPEVMGFLVESGVQPAGPAFSMYHSMSPTEVDVEAGFPIGKEIEGKGRIVVRTVPAGKAVMVWHVGHYEKLGDTYRKLHEWVAAKGFETAGPQWEVYWTDPGVVRDPAKWRTQVFWPVK